MGRRYRKDTIDCLVRIAIDEEELDRVARELAVDPDTIPFRADRIGFIDIDLAIDGVDAGDNQAEI